jgi:competence protein ComEA
MDKTAAPWRVLDDAVGSSAGASEAGDPAETSRGWLTPRLLLGLTAAVGLALGAFALAATGPTGSIEVGGATEWSSSPEALGSARSTSEVVVDVQGAVLAPGVHRLPAGARVGDAIAAAGGYGPRVDAARAASEINLAAVVQDGDRIVVPARGDATPAPAAGVDGGSGASGGLVNVNTATAEELDTLPGVGPVTAQKIIDARAEKPFASVDELKERKVVGAATLEKLRDLVTVR